MNQDFLLRMLKTSSVSGHEITLQKMVIEEMQPFTDTIVTDLTGNVICVLNPEAKFKVLLAGHIDEIGLIITHVLENGLIRVVKAGGIDANHYPGHKVVIETKNGPIYGAVLSSREITKKNVQPEDLLIDIGATSKAEALEVVNIGDPVRLDTDYRFLLNKRLSARALDDRSGAFIVLEALKRAKELGVEIGVYVATTVGEETTMRGARWASERVCPNVALAVDVTYATDYPGTDPATSGDVRLGKGPVLCHSSIVNPHINALLKDLAIKHNIPFQEETFVGRTGTDADQMHFSAQGIATALVSLPLRYMHAPDEICSLDDVQNCIELLAQFLVTINDGTPLDPFQL